LSDPCYSSYGYKFTLKQYAYLLDHFYAGVSLRKLRRTFRALFGTPISEATILRRIIYWIPLIEEALAYNIEKGGDGFDFRFGDRWETDETHFPIKKGELVLMVTRDLTTGFDVGINIGFSVTIEAVKVEFQNAKLTAKKSPSELRCDGLNVYEPAALAVFGSGTKLSVFKKRIKEEKTWRLKVIIAHLSLDSTR